MKRVRLPILAVFIILSAAAGSPAVSQGYGQERFYVSEVFETAATFCPRGTMKPEGQILRISQYDELYTLLQFKYGGDGRTTFALPTIVDPDGQVSNRRAPQWCIAPRGRFPVLRDEDPQREDYRAPEELMALAAEYRGCPRGWRLVEDAGLPHPGTLNWCQPIKGAGEIDAYLAQLLLISADACPTRNTTPADGRTIPLKENQILYSLLGNIYGGDGSTTMALPKFASPAPGVSWCVVTDGAYPQRE